MTDILDNAAAETPSIPAAAAAPTNPDFRWYVVHAYSGMEKAVERNIRESIGRAGMDNKNITTAATKPATKANHCAMTPCGAKV